MLAAGGVLLLMGAMTYASNSPMHEACWTAPGLLAQTQSSEVKARCAEARAQVMLSGALVTAGLLVALYGAIAKATQAASEPAPAMDDGQPGASAPDQEPGAGNGAASMPPR